MSWVLTLKGIYDILYKIARKSLCRILISSFMIVWLVQPFFT